MSNSALKAAIVATRGTIRAREQSALQTLAALWARCKAAILDLLNKFLELMQKARKAAPLTFFWLIEKNRLGNLKAQLAAIIMGYCSAVDALAVQIAQEAEQLGNSAGAAMLAVLGIDGTLTAPLTQTPTSLTWLINKVVEAVGRTMLLEVDGLAPTVEATLERAVSELGWRAESLVRTVLYEAFRSVLIAVFSLAGLGWIWRTEEDRRVCPFCQGMDGTRHAPGEPMRSHNNCRCECEPIALVLMSNSVT